LDIEMPKMDGLTFLRKIMQHHPLPVVVVSAFTQADSDLALAVFEAGAVEVLAKPGGPRSAGKKDELHLTATIREAANIDVGTLKRRKTDQRKIVRSQPIGSSPQGMVNKVIALGASTGGTKALEKVLNDFPVDSPGVVIVQHMPANFTKSFAKRLDRTSPLTIREAREGDILSQGTALLAPGGRHLRVERKGYGYRVRLDDSERIHFQKPAVDPLFSSVAEAAGKNAIGVLLTGMGRDGASGLLAMRQHGAYTIAQDEASSIVFGMPRAAIELGAACEVLALQKITAAIFKVQ
ncbi:MAG: chemotaxis-specific protein-glutamate methyltransferase CheB, partial [Pseudomonadota bacterium]|nr:chemotaxis-specific protein-glutamate methyltransferase CheB [Pseudomonadota bacterium]